MLTQRTANLAATLEKLYATRSADMPFHGWHHIYFVAKKAVEFAQEFEVDKEIIEAAALAHDLNYLVKVNSEPEVGKELREQYLTAANFAAEEVALIENLIMDAHTATRHAQISDSAKALSDADALFKSLPITPIMFAGHYFIENKTDIQKVAAKIAKEQRPLMDQGIYFYTEAAKAKYLQWAKTNLELWENVSSSLDDSDVKEMLEIARRFNIAL